MHLPCILPCYLGSANRTAALKGSDCSTQHTHWNAEQCSTVECTSWSTHAAMLNSAVQWKCTLEVHMWMLCISTQLTLQHNQLYSCTVYSVQCTVYSVLYSEYGAGAQVARTRRHQGPPCQSALLWPTPQRHGHESSAGQMRSGLSEIVVTGWRWQFCVTSHNIHHCSEFSERSCWYIGGDILVQLKGATSSVLLIRERAKNSTRYA